MPTYSYQCKKCEHVQDLFHPMSANPRVKCTECGGSCARLVGKGSGVIFKGSGFYQTDYKNGGAKSAARTDASSEAKSENKTASKSDSKTESKPESKTESKKESTPATKPSTPSKD